MPIERHGRRPRGDGSVFYNEERNRWEGLLDLGKQPDGRQARRKVTGQTEREVRRRLDDLRRKVEAGLPVGHGSMTVSDLLTKWSEAGCPGPNGDKQPGTLAVCAWAIDSHLRPALGTRRLTQLAVEDVEAMLGSRADEGMSRSSLVKLRSVLGQALRWAEKRGYVARNVARLADLPRAAKPAKVRRALTEEEARRLVSAIDGERLGGLFLVMLALGLRPGEASALRWDDLDLDAGLLTIRHSMTWAGGRPQFTEPKTARSRRCLRLPAQVTEAFRQRRSVWREEWLVMASRWPEEWHGLVFVSERGTPLNPSNVRRLLDRFAKEAGISTLVPYELRHSAATMLAAEGLYLEQVADLLGHTDTRMARAHYVHSAGPSIDIGAAPMERLLAPGE